MKYFVAADQEPIQSLPQAWCLIRSPTIRRLLAESRYTVPSRTTAGGFSSKAPCRSAADPRARSMLPNQRKPSPVDIQGWLRFRAREWRLDSHLLAGDDCSLIR